MSQSIIRATFMQALSAYAAAHNPVLTIARENTSYTKPLDGSTFLEAFVIPANTTTPNVAADRRRFLGDFQINVWVKDGSGAGVGEAIAEEISQLFPVYPKTYMPVSIESPASVKKAIKDVSGWLVTPILISYRLEASN
jgi:hypothetical protein